MAANAEVLIYKTPVLEHKLCVHVYKKAIQNDMTYHVDAVVILRTAIFKPNSMSLHIRKIFFCLFRGGGSQTC
jgi:hypothetical protein